jgi:hypothetical protein
MGVTSCYIHGDGVGIRPACKHVLDKIEKGENEKCFSVRVRALPGGRTGEIETQAGPFIIDIPFCLQCYEDKRMSEKMKVTDDNDNIDKAIKDFNIAYGCALCIERYSNENKIN